MNQSPLGVHLEDVEGAFRAWWETREMLWHGKAQDLAFLVLLAVLAAPIGLWGMYTAQSQTIGGAFLLTLAPRGWSAMQMVLATLFLLATMTSLRSPPGVYVVLVSGLTLLAAPFFGAYGGWSGLTVPFAGVAVLTTVHLVGAWWNRPRRLPAVALNLVVVALLGLSMGFGSLVDFVFPSEDTEFLERSAPSGPWVLTATEWSSSGWNGLDQTVAVYWEPLGLFRLERSIYESRGDRPIVRWADSSTVEVNRRHVDIFTDRTITDYSQ
ncbi:MAG: hypothetical protein ACYC5Q_06945 [Thermoleophilia bacterium]